MRVRLTDRANADLEDIARWIARDNLAAARSFPRTLREKCRGIGESAKRSPVIGYVDGDPLRKRTYRKYLIFYIILDDTAEIVRIIHGSRDWATLLGIERS